MAVLVNRPLEGLRWLDVFLGTQLNLADVEALWEIHLVAPGQRSKRGEDGQSRVPRVARRRQPDRPFFAFLNYFDAHWPYRLSPSSIHRFGTGPKNDRERILIDDWSGARQAWRFPAGAQLRERRVRRLRCGSR